VRDLRRHGRHGPAKAHQKRHHARTTPAPRGAAPAVVRTKNVTTPAPRGQSLGAVRTKNVPRRTRAHPARSRSRWVAPRAAHRGADLLIGGCHARHDQLWGYSQRYPERYPQRENRRIDTVHAGDRGPGALATEKTGIGVVGGDRHVAEAALGWSPERSPVQVRGVSLADFVARLGHGGDTPKGTHSLGSVPRTERTVTVTSGATASGRRTTSYRAGSRRTRKSAGVTDHTSAANCPQVVSTTLTTVVSAATVVGWTTTPPATIRGRPNPTNGSPSRSSWTSPSPDPTRLPGADRDHPGGAHRRAAPRAAPALSLPGPGVLSRSTHHHPNPPPPQPTTTPTHQPTSHPATQTTQPTTTPTAQTQWYRLRDTPWCARSAGRTTVMPC
jgi:hypothetical protein